MHDELPGARSERTDSLCAETDVTTSGQVPAASAVVAPTGRDLPGRPDGPVAAGSHGADHRSQAARATLGALPRRAPRCDRAKPTCGLQVGLAPPPGAAFATPTTTVSAASLFERVPSLFTVDGAHRRSRLTDGRPTMVGPVRPTRMARLARLGVTPVNVLLALGFVVVAAVGGFFVGSMGTTSYRADTEVRLLLPADDPPGAAATAATTPSAARSDQQRLADTLRREAAAVRSPEVLDRAAAALDLSTAEIAEAITVTTRAPAVEDGAEARLIIETRQLDRDVASRVGGAVTAAYVSEVNSRTGSQPSDAPLQDGLDRAIAEAQRQLDAAQAALQAADAALRERLGQLPIDQRLSQSNAAVDTGRADVERIVGELSALQAQREQRIVSPGPLRAEQVGSLRVQPSAGTSSPMRHAAIAALGAFIIAGLALTLTSTPDQNGSPSR